MSEDPKLFDAGDYNLFRYCHNDPIDMTDPMGTVEREPWPTHAQQAEALDKIAAARELAGLSSTYIRASLSAIQGQMERAQGLSMGQEQKNTASNRPDSSRYKSGEPYKAERRVDNYEPNVLPNGHIVVTSAVYIKLFDKNGPLAGVEVSETAVPILSARDLVSTRERNGFTERTASNGQLRNPDVWQHTFSSRNGFVTRSQTLMSGANKLEWIATQSATGGMNIYTHQTGYFLQPGSPGY